ncbi:MAG: S9 family peptidase [Desulfurococcales archaeon]|nr:S9 family peptidase [Desulfurococcales archaeon]
MPGLKPEDIYRLSLVSNPVSLGKGAALFVMTRLEKDKYISSIWEYRGKRARILVDSPSTCPSPSPSGDLVAFSRRVGEGEKARTHVIVKDVYAGGEYKLLELRGGVLGIHWINGSGLLVETLWYPEDWKPYNERDYLDIERLPAYFNGVGWKFDRHTAILKVEFPSGRTEMISPEGVDSRLAAVGPKGLIAFYVQRHELRPYEGDIVIYDLKAGKTRTLVKKMLVSDIAFSPDGSRLAVRGHFMERGFATHHNIYLVDVETGKLECLTCEMGISTLNTVNSDVRGPSCTRSLYWDEKGNLYFPVHRRGRVLLYKMTSGGSIEEHVDPGNAVIDEFSVYSDGSLAYTLMNAVEPKELYIMGEKATGFNNWVKTLGLKEPVGDQIMTGNYTLDYWVLPPVEGGECKECVPWVLYIHGGPKTSFGYGFMFEFHVLSSAGYAVVYSNPHGSDGYSEEFADIRGKYGTIDYDDLMTVAKTAPRRHRMLSKSRRAVMGGSYGGWMTNYIISKTDMFKAAVTMRSCSNWVSFYGASDIGWYFAEDQLQATPWGDPEVYIGASPIFEADEIRAATLIIHSLEDYRCPPDQAIALYTALKVSGIKAKLALFPGENHDLMRSGTPRRRVARLKLILEWLKDNL